MKKIIYSMIALSLLTVSCKNEVKQAEEEKSRMKRMSLN